MSNILIMMGHPSSDSFCSGLSEAYAKGAKEKGAAVRTIHIGELQFNPNLQHGYKQRIELEGDLIAAQEAIQWADHLVFVYPNWWGTMPALLKGFIDRVFLPGFAFKYRTNSALWDQLLIGKSARLIVTMDTPSWFNRFVYGQPGHKAMKRTILQFCGVNPVRITEIGPVRPSTEEKRKKWLKTVEQLGARFQ